MVGNVCTPVLLVTLLIAVNSYLVYILTYLPHVQINQLADVTFEGHICYWHIYGKSIIIKSCSSFDWYGQ